ncbi:four helix bundle protein [Fibrivirga algicola]|uniref:Four helix bundle protein n=1 Tax=Fibrivirga algicola TaxID=2950420 RepID=A0ABX0QAM3_9BACT|nr:four helix bundle protein [Fibrivirga algicola]NID09310.1 four helix bundle protein [Fibrivirga algicola]
MATIQRFEELKSWQKARELAQEVYRLSKQGAFARDLDLRSQIRRASGSVMDKIAEGFERGGKGELIQFLSIAKGSAGEVRSPLYRALDQTYIDQSTFDLLYKMAEDISKLITNFISYLNKAGIKGNKYQVSEDEVSYAPL